VYGVVRGWDVPDIFAFDGHFHSAGVAALARVLSEVPIDESVRAFAVDHQILGDGVGFIGKRLSVLLESRVAVFGCGCRLDPKDVVNEVESDGANAWMEVVWDGVSSGLIVSVLSLDDDGGSVKDEEASFGGDAMDFSDDGDDGLQIGFVVGVVCVVACVVVWRGCESEMDGLVGDGCEGVQCVALNDLHGRRLHFRRIEFVYAHDSTHHRVFGSVRYNGDGLRRRGGSPRTDASGESNHCTGVRVSCLDEGGSLRPKSAGGDHAVGIGVYHHVFVCPVVGVRETVGGHWHGFVVNDGAWVRAVLELERHCRDVESSPAKVLRRLENYLFECYRFGRKTPAGDFERGGRLLWIRVNGNVGRVTVCWVSMSRRLPETEQDYYRDVEFPVSFVVVPSLELREWMGV